MATKSLPRKWYQRLLGIPATCLPADPGSWSYSAGTLVLDLARVPELSAPGTAVRLEGGGLPARILVVRADDGSYRAFQNRCRHFFRRLDPVPGTGTIQCCSVNKATYDMEGKVVSGPARGPVTAYPVTVEGGKLRIAIA